MKILAIFAFLIGVNAFGYEIGPVGVYSSYAPTGFNQTTGSTNLNYSFSNTGGYGGGLVAIFPMSSVFDLEIRALYVNLPMNGTVTGTSSGFAVSGTVVSTEAFFQFPVFINLMLGKYFGLHAGPYFDLATGTTTATATLTVGGIPASSTSSAPNTGNDYGVAGGLEVRAELSSSVNLFISGDYFYGLTNLNASSSTSGASNSRIIQGVAGFLFKMGRD
jgi:hypothetical protein